MISQKIPNWIREIYFKMCLPEGKIGNVDDWDVIYYKFRWHIIHKDAKLTKECLRIKLREFVSMKTGC